MLEAKLNLNQYISKLNYHTTDTKYDEPSIITSMLSYHATEIKQKSYSILLTINQQRGKDYGPWLISHDKSLKAKQ